MSRHHQALSILLGLLAVVSVCFSYVIQQPDEEAANYGSGIYRDKEDMNSAFLG